MVAKHGLMRIFWPLDLPLTASPGVIIGWKNSSRDVFVLAILGDVEPRSVENALRVGTLYRNPKHSITRMFQLCGRSSVHVLGLSNPGVQTGSNTSYIHAYTRPSSRFPSISCPNDDGDVTVQVIMFKRPNPTQMQYLSLKPMPLALGDKDDRFEINTSSKDSANVEEQGKRARRTALVNKLRLHSVIKHPPSEKEICLPDILSQANCSMEMARLLQLNIGLVRNRQKRTLSVGERVVHSATTIWDRVTNRLWILFVCFLYPIITRLFVTGLICHRIVAELILTLLQWRPRPDYAALKDVSATAQQVDIRLQQFCYWPIQYLTLRKRKNDWESVTDSHPDYIRFYNSLWLVANDVIIGISIGSYINDNADWVVFQINYILNGWTVEGLRRTILWLMDWPAGLKLNKELADFLGDLFLWVIDYWKGSMGNLRPFLPHLVYFIGFSSFAGASMPIALFSDLLSVLTVHIYSFYIASARIYNWQLTIIISLFHLFRGKKRNVLRNRIDSCDYDLDQLLLGTIFFTLLFFLLPTVLVFYLTFASARMAIISLKAVLDTLLACLNHFPLFALMLRIKDSRRLPGGIQFELRDTPLSSASFSHSLDNTPPPTSYIILQSVPLPIFTLFNQYFQLGHRIRKHYLSPRVILCLATGRFVPPIHRKSLYSLQYSMLPARRAGIMEVWSWLNEADPPPVAGWMGVNGISKSPGRGHKGRGHH